MSSGSNSTSRARIGIVRLLFPVVVLAAAATVWTIAHTWKSTEADSSSLSMAKMVAVLVAAGLVFLWALRMPNWRKRYVWLALLGAAGLGLAAFKPIGMSGNFLPIVAPRDWVQDTFLGGSRDTVLERHREGQPKAEGGADLVVRPGDWAEYRGPNQDGVVEGPAPFRHWIVTPPKEVWRQPVGGGYAAFVVANGFLVTIEQRRDREVVACYRADTGKEVWTAGWPAKFQEALGGDGPRATPTIADGDVFAYGAKGRLVCLNGADGAEKWAVETLDGNANIQWAMSGSPLVVGDLVVVNPGAQTEAAKGRAVRAYDRKTGTETWVAGNHKAGYASPQLTTLREKPQVLIFDADGLAGHDPKTGAELWRFSWPTYQGINVAQPVAVDGSNVFIGAGYGAGGALLRVAEAGGKWTVTEVWRTKTTVMRLKFASGVRRKTADGDHLYGLNDGILECMDLKTGKSVWKDDRRAKEGEAFGHGQILLADDLIVALTEFGELVLVEATPTAYKERGRIKALKEGEKTWNNPAMAGGRIYIRNAAEMACYDLTGKSE